MKQVILKPLYHRQQECIGIYFQKDSLLNSVIQKQASAKWSQTNKCWYVPLSKEKYNTVFFALKGVAQIEQSTLYQYIADKGKENNNKKQLIPVVVKAKPATGTIITSTNNSLTSKYAAIYKTEKIQPVNAHVLPAMRQKLQLKAYSTSTIKTYINEMAQLLQAIKNIPADELNPEHLRRYLVYCYEKLKLTENTLHSRINAMKFYYEQVLGREKFFWEIPRPKKQYILPRVLGETELKRLFNALQNKKHKAILFTAYSAGLRVSEVVNLELKHVDRSRMQLLIRMPKGKKTGM